MADYSTAGICLGDTEDFSLAGCLWGILGHSPEDLQVLGILVSSLIGREKLLFTPLNHSLLQHLLTRSLEPCNLGERRIHVNAKTFTQLYRLVCAPEVVK